MAQAPEIPGCRAGAATLIERPGRDTLRSVTTAWRLAILASTDAFCDCGTWALWSTLTDAGDAILAWSPWVERPMSENPGGLEKKANASKSLDEFRRLSSVVEPSFDLAAYRRNGIQIVRGFFEPALTERFKSLAAKIGKGVSSGRVTRTVQFAIGVNLAEARLSESAKLHAVAAQVLGEKIGQTFVRVLMKDKTFKSSIGAHQDWPYYGGDTRKLNVFIPLTPCGPHNGMIKFHVGSHALGPVERGDIDVDRYPDLVPVVPDLDVGDVLFADILTWHSSIQSLTDDDRILIQLALQPLSDPSSTIEFGKGKHKRLRQIPWRSTPMLNARPSIGSDVVNGLLNEGSLDEAERMARGLSIDSPLNVEARLFLAEIASRRGQDNHDQLREADAAHLELSRRVEDALGRPASASKPWADTTAALQADLAVQAETTAALRSDLAVQSEGLAIQAETNRAMTQALEAAQRELAEKSAELEARRKELQLIKSSSSWKLTAPIRSVIFRLRSS